MTVILVHHAEAMSPAVESQRPLSARGHEQAAGLAERALAAGFRPAAIWHSGKLRARQTAEPFLKLNPFAEFKMVRGLLSEDRPEIMRDTLRYETRDVLLVGHMPNIADLTELLTEGAAPMPLHGLVALETTDGVQWKIIDSFRP